MYVQFMRHYFILEANSQRIMSVKESVDFESTLSHVVSMPVGLSLFFGHQLFDRFSPKAVGGRATDIQTFCCWPA